MFHPCNSLGPSDSVCLGKDILHTVNLTLFASFIITNDSLVTPSGSLKVYGHNACIGGASWVLILLNIFFIDMDDGMKSILTWFADDTKGRRVCDGTAAFD